MLSFKYIILLLCFIWVVRSESGNVNLSSRSKEIHTKCVHPGLVALTFGKYDGGPSPGTDAILDVLRRYNVKATFFINKQNSEKNIDPVEAKKTLLQINNDGHQIGIKMPSMKFNTTSGISTETILKQMTDLDDHLLKIIGIITRIVRLPYGEENEMVLKILQDHQYSIIKWNIDTIHNGEDVNNAGMEAYNTAMKATSSQNSSFIALHRDAEVEDAFLTKTAIVYIRSKGYWPVRILQCIG